MKRTCPIANPLPTDGTLGHLERKAIKVEDDLGLLARKVDGMEKRLDQAEWDSDRVRSAIQLGRKALKVQDEKLEEMKVLLDVLYQVIGSNMDELDNRLRQLQDMVRFWSTRAGEANPVGDTAGVYKQEYGPQDEPST